jgi:hypothetical protein
VVALAHVYFEDEPDRRDARRRRGAADALDYEPWSGRRSRLSPNARGDAEVRQRGNTAQTPLIFRMTASVFFSA